MGKSFVQKLKQRMRTWERCPYSYEFKDKEVHHCLNCYHDFTGNFCPYCSQAANTKRISWKSIFNSFIELWDFRTRSVPSTLWQLTYRPGYLIRDYLQGRRLTSFAPIKMLLVVAFFTTIIENYIVDDVEERKARSEMLAKKVENGEERRRHQEDSSLAEVAPQQQEGESGKVIAGVSDDLAIDYLNLKYDEIGDWCRNHQGWAMLMLCSLLILPTWWLFRHSRRTPKHTLPEGFYIQVFMCQMLLIIGLFDEFLFLAPLYYVYTYRQLFGYSTWGTVWRLLVCFLFTIFVFLFLVLFLSYVFLKWKTL